MKDHVEIMDAKCTNCGRELDSSFGMTTDDMPSPGDVSICVDCSHIMIYTEGLGLRDCTNEELDSITRQDDVISALIALAKVRRDRE